MRGKRGALVQALTGRFDAHHAELARMLLDHYDALTVQIDRLTARIQELIAAIPAAQLPGDGAGPTGGGEGGSTGAGAHQQTAQPPLGRWTGWTRSPASASRPPRCSSPRSGWTWASSPPPAHLVSWARLSPRTIQSGAKHRAGATGKGNPYLKGVLGEVAAAAAKTDTFLGERYRRLVRRIGKLKALVAIARSVLVIVWHLLADPTARFYDLGAGYYTSRIDTDRKTRSHVRQLQALGYSVTLTPAA
jgi:transposase